ncbi:MAG: hypothetical protein O7G31_00620 [Calditrichaeota bacterium]|nr:hypothetical protein [Calditrichota bacterium]
MALTIGSVEADAGMSQLVYLEMDIQLSPPLQNAIDQAEEEADAKAAAENALAEARNGWKKLSYAIAKGVINHILTNMVITGIETEGDVSTSISGNTGETDGHLHTVELTGGQADFLATQSNDGVGHVE